MIFRMTSLATAWWYWLFLSSNGSVFYRKADMIVLLASDRRMPTFNASGEEKKKKKEQKILIVAELGPWGSAAQRVRFRREFSVDRVASEGVVDADDDEVDSLWDFAKPRRDHCGLAQNSTVCRPRHTHCPRPPPLRTWPETHVTSLVTRRHNNVYVVVRLTRPAEFNTANGRGIFEQSVTSQVTEIFLN